MTTPGNNYLETEVATATPQRLRLMLIDGAIRFANQALARWRADGYEHAADAVGRCHEILGELLSAVRNDGSDVTRNVAGIYVCLLRTVSQASLSRDPQKLEQVMAALHEERITWQQLCQQMPDRPAEDHAPAEEITAGSAPAIPAPHLGAAARVASPERFSLDA